MGIQVLVEETVVRLIRTAVTTLPEDVVAALHRALEHETEEVARVHLRTVIENVRLAETKGVPMCQDTGVPIFFVSGPCSSEVEEGMIKGVVRATREVPLRPNVVHPLKRHGTGSNIGEGMPVIHHEPPRGDFIEIAFMPKGAGSENMSVIKMLDPTKGIRGVKETVLEAVVAAGGRPCPPSIVGVGVGGTADSAMLLAKRALLRPLGRRNKDDDIADLESELEDLINMTGIGPMGLGGRTTALAVAIEKADCHTASLPVAVNIQCWAARRAFARIYPDGKVRFSTEGFE
ncbi:MAG: fumarate hydratase [Methanomassiliicoccales archaeon]|nr:MAG: fumarate hydratase [Methanomassiliicoccales archaeon]